MPNNKLKISFQTPHVTVEPHVDSPNPGDEFTGHKPRKNVLFLLFSCRAFRLGICGLFKPTTSFPHEWNLAKFETGVQEFCAHGKKKKGPWCGSCLDKPEKVILNGRSVTLNQLAFCSYLTCFKVKRKKKIALFKILWFSIKKCIHEIYSELVF